MRSIWKGTVSFGLVSIGVKLFSATEERDVSLPPGPAQRRLADPLPPSRRG